MEDPNAIKLDMLLPSLTLSIPVTGPQNAGRHKINCTAPARSGAGVFYWYSVQWLVQKPDGSWYRE